MNKQLLPLSLAMLAAFPAYAQNSFEHFEITGSRLQSDHIGAESILSREQIEQINPSSTLELLRRVPNIIVAENGNAGGLSYVSVRGGESNFTLILIDNVAVNDPTNSRGGGFDFNQIDPQTIERVEVYRGGISAIYGGDAISGVIHFITRQSDTRAVTLEAGNQQQRAASVVYSAPVTSTTRALFSASSRHQQGQNFADYENNQMLAKLDMDQRDTQIAALVSYSDQQAASLAEDSGGIRFAAPMQPETRDSHQWLTALRLSHQFTPELSFNTQVSWIEHVEDVNNPGIASGVLSGIPASQIESRYEKTEAEAFLVWDTSDALTLLAGAAVKRADGENTGFLDFGFPLPVDYQLEQDTDSVFVEGQYESGQWRAELGLRVDDAEQFDDETSVRASVEYRMDQQQTLHAVYNEGYKLPSFFALAHPLVGNPNLAPEESENLELGWQLSLAATTAQFNLFHNRFSDLVDFDPVQFTSINQSEVVAKGAEITLAHQFTRWLDGRIDVSYVDTDIRDSDASLRRRPNWFGGVSINSAYQDYNLSLFADFRSSVTDSSIPTGSIQLGGYAVFGLNASWQLNRNTNVYVKVENLLDRAFEESVGFVQDQAEYRLGVTYNL